MPTYLTRIPPEVVEQFYGCGSPVSAAALQPGETMVHLGSDAGIDVFLAARKVGPEGRALGVDMTDRMLAVARESQPKAAAALGVDAVEFRRGFLERIGMLLTRGRQSSCAIRVGEAGASDEAAP